MSHFMKSFWLFCLFIFSLQIPVSLCAEEDPCTVHANGKYWDLNPLRASTDYKIQLEGKNEIVLNACRGVASETWTPRVDKPEAIAGFSRRDHGDFSIGAVNTTLTVVDDCPVMSLINGSPCANGGDLRGSSFIRFICDPSEKGPLLVAQLPPGDQSSCSFFIEWRTKYACPTSEPGSWGFFAVLFTIIFVLFGLYFFSGIMYNYFVLQLRGFDVIPRYSLESLRDTIDFLKDCVIALWSRATSSFHSSSGISHRSWGNGGGGYRGLSSSREESTSILGGPPGFLDEDEDEEAAPGLGHNPQLESTPPQGMDSSGVIHL